LVAPFHYTPQAWGREQQPRGQKLWRNWRISAHPYFEQSR